MRYDLLKRGQFLEDHREIVLHLAEVNAPAADRFCDAVEAALDILASNPEIGPRTGFPKAPDTRFWPLRQYPHYLVFYRIEGNSVVALRLLHGARDLPPLILGK